MLRIHAVRDSLRSPGHNYPQHSTGDGIEGFFDKFANEHVIDVKTDWIYLPIRWTNNYVMDRDLRRDGRLTTLRAHQAVLDSLSPRERYFTVVQCDDGIYENVPDNVFVFGAGGVGDEAIPLLCDQHPQSQDHTNELLATFVGKIECGGPVKSATKQMSSSFNMHGAGATVRRAMQREFCNQRDCIIVQSHCSTEIFRHLLNESTFALCPRGYGKTSFRLYEAMQLGCVPVYIYDEPWLPYANDIDWDSFCVLCHSSQISELPARLREITMERVNSSLNIARKLHDRYFTMQGMSRRILEMVERLSA